jgi:D-alanyl-D-alanine carboxypeptidase (penicillin-binding protein 5/6)
VKCVPVFSLRGGARVLAARQFRVLGFVASACVGLVFGGAQARNLTQISPILPRPTPMVPLSAAQVAAPPAVDARTARFHAARLFNYGQVRAPAWILMDADSGRVLAGHNARARMFPASTTKTLTALVALSEGNLDSIVRIGANPPKTGEQSAYLLEGEQFSLRDLLSAAMIKSANDACVAIAEGVGGSVPKFVKRMNAKAKEIGASDSHFVNPHGLHDPNHYTTPHDLALIARAAMRYLFFNETTKTREAEIHGNWKLRGARLLVNKNRLLFRWAACDGVKTGYTKQAGRCLIASATQTVRDDAGQMRDFRLIAVVMHSPDASSDAWFALQKLGFDRFRPNLLARENEVVGETGVAGASMKAQAAFPKTIEIPVRLASTRSDATAPITRRLDYIADLKAPLLRGRVVGTATFIQNGVALTKVPLVCAADVPKSTLASVLPAAANIFLPSVLMQIVIALVALTSLALLLAAWRQHKVPSKNERTRTPKRRR